MMRILKLGISSLALGLTASFLAAQQSKEAAPIPAQIISAQKVFISNAGVDGMALAAFKREGEPDKHYSQFYAAMKAWGRYELVADPGDANLVFEIRFTAPISGCDKLTSYAPQFGLSILDAKTHFAIWTLIEPVQGAYRKGTWDKNFNLGLTALMTDLKKLADPAAVLADDVRK